MKKKLVKSFTIIGKPIAKKRPSFFSKQLKGGDVIKGAFNSQMTEEGRWLIEACQQIGYKLNGTSPKLLEGGIYLNCKFVMPITKSTVKRMRELILLGKIAHVKTPDLDNLIKFVKDCLNGVVWEDDKQVAEIQARKIYGEQPRTIIEIYSLISI